jgi:UrcA family protein
MRASFPLIGSFRSNLYLIAAIGVCTGASAQPAALEEVTVTAPTVKTIGRDATGTPIRELGATVRVQYNPIMLTTNSGRALLDDKVAEVARMLCSAGDTVSNTDDDGNCVRQAVKTAKAQLDAATIRVK